MKIGPKLILTLFIVITLGSVAQVAYRFIVDRNQMELELQTQAENTMKRLLNGLAQPIWNFDTSMIETIMRLELADFNLQAIQMTNSLGKLTHFLGRRKNNIQIQDLVLADPSVRQGIIDNAYLTVTEKLEYDGYLLGHVSLYYTNEVITRKTWNQAFSLIFQSLVVALILMLVLWYALQRIIVEPIVELTTVVLKIFKNGDLSIRSPIRSKDEIGMLSKQYNQMLEIIEEHTKNLENKVSERTRDLAAANTVLKQQKDEIDRNLQMAQKIQLNLIPNEKTYPVRQELHFNGLYKAMDAIGGDIFDVIRCGRNSYGILMADVSGHGIPAALVTAMAKVSFNTHAQQYGIHTSEVCSRVNKDITRLLGNDFSHYLTAFFGIIDLEKKTFIYSNCGHHPALLIRQQTILSLGSPGPFIGFIENATFYDESIELQEGDRLVLFTDGIVEAKNEAGELYDTPRLINLCRIHANHPSKDLIQSVLNDLKQFCGNLQADDDRAILIVDYLREQTKLEQELDFQSGKIFKSEKKEIKVHLQEAVLLARQGHLSESLNLLEELYDSHPSNVKVVINLSLVLYKTGNYEKALAILKKAYDENKDNSLKDFMERLQSRIQSGNENFVV